MAEEGAAVAVLVEGALEATELKVRRASVTAVSALEANLRLFPGAALGGAGAEGAGYRL